MSGTDPGSRPALVALAVTAPGLTDGLHVALSSPPAMMPLDSPALVGIDGTVGITSGGHRSDPMVRRAEIAQLVEHATENRGVASSNLALGTKPGTEPAGRKADIERKWLSW